jgi:hypothetical protein
VRNTLAVVACLAALTACRTPAPQQPDLDPRIEALLAAISEERLATLLKGLVSFETRHLASNPDPAGRGIGAARQWIFDELEQSSPKLQVSFDTYQVAAQGQRILRDVELRNVVAILPGRSARRIYVSGHYDSIARLPNPPSEAGPAGPAGIHWNLPDMPAPGANDDGSGTALTMELARVFATSGIDFDATLVFIAFAGEEEGLVGAHLHAEKARAESIVIEAVFNNDIVGGVAGGNGLANGDSMRVFSDGPEDSPSRQLARHVRTAAARYVPGHEVRLIARYDRFLRGGDHIAFNERGFPAIRLSEMHENYQRQHELADTIDGVSFPYLTLNARVNAAGVATLALAPPAPRVVSNTGAPSLERAPSTVYGTDAKLRWQVSPGAAGYRVYWRDAWAPDWENTVSVGNVTEHLLPNMSIDNFVFGVAAVGESGHQSLVAAYVNPPRTPTTVKTLSK